MALIDDVMMSARADDYYKPEVQGLIEQAKDDMRRVGVKDALLDASEPAPLVKRAVTCYVKATFGFDNPDMERFYAMYRQCVTDLLNSTANEASTLEYNMTDGDAA